MGSFEGAIGSGSLGVALQVEFLYGALRGVEVVTMLSLAPVACVLCLRDACGTETVSIVVRALGPVPFATTRASQFALHSASRVVTATWRSAPISPTTRPSSRQP